MTAVNPGGWGRDRATCAARLRRVGYLTGLGWTRVQIAAELGVSARRVDEYRRRARLARGGVPPASRDDPGTVAEMTRLYVSGLSHAAVAVALGVSKGRVRRALSRAGVPARSRAEAGRLARARLPPRVPEHGTRREYDLGCTCRPCRDAYAAYQRAWRARRRDAG